MGIVAGILMAVASAVLTSYLGMHEGPEDVAEQQRRALGHKKQAYLGQYLRRDPQGLEPDWHWADTASPARFRRASGLQTETIHEEEDSEE
jgi:hypothetical protein